MSEIIVICLLIFPLNILQQHDYENNGFLKQKNSRLALCAGSSKRLALIGRFVATAFDKVSLHRHRNEVNRSLPGLERLVIWLHFFRFYERKQDFTKLKAFYKE